MNLSTVRQAVLLCVVCCSLTAPIYTQTPLRKTFIDSTVNKLGKLMLDYYIIKDKGEAAQKMLTQKLGTKKYYNLDGGTLANALVEDLRSVTADKHLMIKFYPGGDAAADYPAEDKTKEEEYRPSALSLKRSRFDNYGVKEAAVTNLNTGYLKLDGFYDIRNPETTKAIAAAMQVLSHTNGIIIDLSDNTGGDPATLQFLLSYFFKTDPPTHYNTFHFRDGNDHFIEERTLPFVPGERMPKTPLYVITSEKTFSAGEAFAYALQQLNRATIIGQTTGGGAHAANFKLINDYFDMSIPLARAINPVTHNNWEGTGVKPNVAIALSKAKDYAYAELIKQAMQQETDPILLGRYQWELEALESRLDEFSYRLIELEKYTGSFEGDRRVFIENGKLKYQKGQGQIATLTPLNKTSFTADLFSTTRIAFDFDGNTLLGLKLYIETGQFNLARKME